MNAIRQEKERKDLLKRIKKEEEGENDSFYEHREPEGI